MSNVLTLFPDLESHYVSLEFLIFLPQLLSAGTPSYSDSKLNSIQQFQGHADKNPEVYLKAKCGSVICHGKNAACDSYKPCSSRAMIVTQGMLTQILSLLKFQSDSSGGTTEQLNNSM